jgi:glycosyltransferase involved in cell wall biosynthesis
MPCTLVHIVTVPESLKTFLGGQVRYMKSQGLEVHAVSSPGPLLETFGETEGIHCHEVPMPRKISPFRDLLAIASLCATLYRIRPQMVHAHTPKAGLLGMIAAWILRVPIRIYHIHGLPLVTMKGPRRWLLMLSESVASLFATQVLCVSRSVRNVAVQHRLCSRRKLAVLRFGSCNGIDVDRRFNPQTVTAGAGLRVRDSLGIPHDALTIGFVGRLAHDKGLIELDQAWKKLRDEFPELRLIIVGSRDARDPLHADIEASLREDPRVHIIKETTVIEEFYAAFDICVLPTYREGLPNVLLEAGAMHCATVATRVPGCIDVVRDGKTGLLVPPRDAQALQAAIRQYLVSKELRTAHGKAARLLVKSRFRHQPIWDALYQEYRTLAATHGITLADSNKCAIPDTLAA